MFILQQTFRFDMFPSMFPTYFKINCIYNFAMYSKFLFFLFTYLPNTKSLIICICRVEYILKTNVFFFQSGAIINISDGSCPERIVTVSGSTNAIYKAFSLITKKFEEVTAILIKI